MLLRSRRSSGGALVQADRETGKGTDRTGGRRRSARTGEGGWEWGAIPERPYDRSSLESTSRRLDRLEAIDVDVDSRGVVRQGGTIRSIQAGGGQQRFVERVNH